VDTQTLRAGLRNFRTRSDTIDQAIAAGSDAVAPASELLQDRNDATRWSAIQILSEISDEAAIPPLLALMDHGKNTIEAANALRQITGKDFGEDPADWRKGLGKAAPSAGPTERIELTDAALIAAATQDMNVEVASKGDRYTVQVKLDNGRGQQVIIDFSSKDAEGAPIVRLYTLCGKAEPDKYEWALKNNMKLPYGAIGLAMLNGTPCFAMVDAYCRATADAEDLGKSISNLAANGDMVEKLLTKQDRY
jgi:HEAT repeats